MPCNYCEWQEFYDGSCMKPKNKPCPYDEEDVKAYEQAEELKQMEAMGK